MPKEGELGEVTLIPGPAKGESYQVRYAGKSRSIAACVRIPVRGNPYCLDCESSVCIHVFHVLARRAKHVPEAG
jgi:hypothetical protein